MTWRSSEFPKERQAMKRSDRAGRHEDGQRSAPRTWAGQRREGKEEAKASQATRGKQAGEDEAAVLRNHAAGKDDRK